MIKLTDILIRNKKTGKKYDVKKVNPEKHEFAWDYRGSKENPNPFKKADVNKQDTPAKAPKEPAQREPANDDPESKAQQFKGKSSGENIQTMEMEGGGFPVRVYEGKNYGNLEVIP